MVLFKQKVKKIKSAAHKNGDVDGTCKRGIRINVCAIMSPISTTHLRLTHTDGLRLRLLCR